MEENMLRQSTYFTARKLGILLLTLCVAGLGTTLLSRAGAPEHETAPAGTTISSDITTDTTWTLAGSPYSVTKLDLYINSGVTLTIEPGVEVLLMDRAKVHVDTGATLVAKGTPSQHISFTNMPASRWKTINHYAGSTSYYRYVDFTGGGKDMGSLHYVGPGTHTLNNCVIEHTKRHGIYAHGSGLSLRIAGTRIADYEIYGLAIADGAVVEMTGSEVYQTERKHGVALADANTVFTVTSSSIIVPHPNVGILNESSGSVCVSAQDNWWGHSSGPSGGGGGACSPVGGNPGSGTALTPGVDWRNYRTTATSRIGITTTPVASFTVSPDPSIAQPPGTNHTFDGSASTDAEDYASSLQFCWDWEDDGGGCDTTAMTAVYSFSVKGWHTTHLVITDTDGLTSTVTQDILSDYSPTTAFAVTQTTWAQIMVDPSGTYDVDDDSDTLQVQWDWEGDGVWDTGVYSVTDIVPHTYDHIGRYWPTIRVGDPYGAISTLSKQVDIIPPVMPSSPVSGGGMLVSADGTVTITWASGVITDGTVITHTPWITVPTGYGALPGDFTYQGFELAAESGGLPIGSAGGPFTITVEYDLNYYGNVLDLWASESLLKLYRWNGSEWVLVSFAIDSGQQQLVATTDSFGDFALVLEAQKVYLPLALQAY
jgi:hypothetical protein